MRIASATSATFRSATAGRSSITATNMIEIMIHERTVGNDAPEIKRYPNAASIAAAAAHFLIGNRSATAGTSASANRTTRNTAPAITTMCRPEIDRMCSRPESRKASLVASDMPPRCPVMSALAISPRSPVSAAVTRLPMACRVRSIAARTCALAGPRSASRSVVAGARA
jgi:hypothetical protein